MTHSAAERLKRPTTSFPTAWSITAAENGLSGGMLPTRASGAASWAVANMSAERASACALRRKSDAGLDVAGHAGITPEEPPGAGDVAVFAK